VPDAARISDISGKAPALLVCPGDSTEKKKLLQEFFVECPSF
jgi:hypothetical protein